MSNLDVGYKVLPEIKSAGLQNSADFVSNKVGGRKRKTMQKKKRCGKKSKKNKSKKKKIVKSSKNINKNI